MWDLNNSIRLLLMWTCSIFVHTLFICICYIYLCTLGYMTFRGIIFLLPFNFAPILLKTCPFPESWAANTDLKLNILLFGDVHRYDIGRMHTKFWETTIFWSHYVRRVLSYYLCLYICIIKFDANYATIKIARYTARTIYSQIYFINIIRYFVNLATTKSTCFLRELTLCINRYVKEMRKLVFNKLNS